MNKVQSLSLDALCLRRSRKKAMPKNKVEGERSHSSSLFSTLSLGAFDEVEITPTTRGSTALDSTLSNTTKPNQGMKFRSRNYRVVFPVVELRSTLGPRFRRSHSPLCGVRFAYSTESKQSPEQRKIIPSLHEENITKGKPKVSYLRNLSFVSSNSSELEKKQFLHDDLSMYNDFFRHVTR